MAMRKLFVPADRTEDRIRTVMHRIVGKTTLGQRILSKRQHLSKAAQRKTVDIGLA
ncbi:hypothetical protein ACIG56_10465 [Nocardia fusca]|uniref:hypothetical protein n=1 Tax=Nocardia fusca TaxID=941183 RepID=UPI0037C68605